MGFTNVQVSRAPGWLKIQVPAYRRRRRLIQKLKYLLQNQQGIDKVSVLPVAGIFRIRFNSTLTDENTIISILCSISSSEIKSVRIPIGKSNLPNPLYLDQHPRTSLVLSLVTIWISVYGRVPVSILVVMVNIVSLPVYRRAVEALINEKKLSVDFLDALAHIFAQFQRNFSAVAFMSTFLSAGYLIRQKTAEQAERVITDVLSFEKDEAWIERDGEKVRVLVADIHVGDIVIIYPGSVIPVDGMVVHGSSLIDQKSLTGESLPVTRTENTKVYAGTIVLDGVIKILAEKVGQETSVARIVKVVSEGANHLTIVEDYARRFGDGLVIPTLGISAFVSLITGDLQRFTSMVIVDYGTGIRLAAPTAVLSQIIFAARSGVLIKGGRSIEKLHNADTVVFDKTGTLTFGEPSIIDLLSYDEDLRDRDLIGIAAAAESKFTHPVALAIRRKAGEEEIDIKDAKEAEYRVGYGVESYIDGTTVLIGSQRFMTENNIDISLADEDSERFFASGKSVIFIAMNGKLAGLLSYSDTLRPEAADVVKSLRLKGIQKIVMLTGDNRTVAASVARQVGIDDFVAEILPEEKMQYVQNLQKKGRTVIAVGDGINDSPALTEADVGVSVRSGVEMAREAADVILLEENLWKVLDAFHVSSRTMEIIEQDRKLLLAINTGVFGAAAFGVLSPVISSALSDGASILATLNSLRPLIRESKSISTIKQEELQREESDLQSA